MTHVSSSTILVWFAHREFVRFGTPINLHDTVDLTVGDDYVWASEWEDALGACRPTRP